MENIVLNIPNKGPCMGCKFREVNCHSYCQEYIKYSEDRVNKIREINTKKFAETSWDKYYFNRVNTERKKKGLL